MIVVSNSELLFATKAPSKAAKITLAPNDITLYQGDSIMDTGRKRDPRDADVSNTVGTLGSGYAYLAAELLLRHTGKKLVIYNCGISGNKVYELADRWDKDCLGLKLIDHELQEYPAASTAKVAFLSC